MTTIEKPDREIHRAQFEIWKNGKVIDAMHADKHIHPNFQPATEVGIRSTLVEDLYLVLADYNLNNETITLSVLINPLLLWMWIGGVIMVLGTLVAMSPQEWRMQA